jgi:hypothetical protein
MHLYTYTCRSTPWHIPRGTSCELYTITPWYCGVDSVIRAKPLFRILLPYKNDISCDCLIHTLYCTLSMNTIGINNKNKELHWLVVCTPYRGMLCQIVQARHVQRKLFGFGELTKADAQRKQLLLANVGSQLHDAFADIKHSLLV